MRYKFIVRSYLPVIAETFIDAEDDAAALQKFKKFDGKDFNWREDALRPDKVTYEIVTPDDSKVISEAQEAAYQGC
mgnify:CR=1 FL=1|jgi:hypothetical protein|tara:strand:+ start:174 stop:401 length:228 start_codon:yes stop_codon:yes gene_type:complete